MPTRSIVVATPFACRKSLAGMDSIKIEMDDSRRTQTCRRLVNRAILRERRSHGTLSKGC